MKYFEFVFKVLKFKIYYKTILQSRDNKSRREYFNLFKGISYLMNPFELSVNIKEYNSFFIGKL